MDEMQAAVELVERELGGREIKDSCTVAVYGTAVLCIECADDCMCPKCLPLEDQR